MSRLKNLLVYVREKLFNDIAKCSKCNKFYHLECMNIKNVINEWMGPCCICVGNAEYIEIR